MGADRDSPSPLPDPPPPRPDRREAAIAAALDRFDAAGTESQPGQPQRRAPSIWTPLWTLRNRPQFGALVAASLVAVISMPVLWVVLGNPRPSGPAPVALDTYERMPRVKVPSPSSPPPPPAAVERPEPAAPAADIARQESPAASTEAAADAVETAVAAAPTPPPPPPPAPLRLPAAPPPAVVTLPAPVPAPAPPPPEREAARSAESAALSAFRKRDDDAPRGDWNACTLDDPARSLQLCTNRIDAAAKGARGRASAFLADGLMSGWEGDLDGAISAFNRAIETDPGLAAAYLNRGLAYQRKGDLDRARADLDRAVEQAPSEARTHYARSRLLRARGETAAAGRDEERALQLAPAYKALITPSSER